MAKKSSKTTHVLNLLSGHDTKKEPEIVQPQSAETPAVSIIDTTEKDPVAEQIQENLLHELEKETEVVPETKPESEIEATPEVQQAEATPEVQQAPQPEATQQTAAAPEVQQAPQPEATQQAAAAPETTQQTAAIPEVQQVPQPEATQQTVAAPEPEFVHVNIMEEIVRDKIIYFMRQFDCCTCDRCIADAIALTLNGLMPKYIVTDPAAKDPLISLYTNRFIPDVTVEATKACMIIKENPRHK
ncbi:late competence development ComFB family protein [Mediterraneibacter agrestimuris]|uniref:late competence development ComFB family protein n=1 Tax=Mediterraneibacter agrestimuris TaxID=2941333 RepID=UPI0020412521|nr:late competence development ComFB family protein [Mediterraneibacter agrestimuris]